MKRVTEFLISHFQFTPIEIRGFFVLLVLLLFFTFLPFFWSKLLPIHQHDVSSDQAILDSLLLSMKPIEPKANFVEFASKDEISIKLFDFDPNTAPLQDLIKLGIKDYLAKRIIKYREKGGHFLKEEDLLKIYGFSEETYQTLLPYIKIVKQNRFERKSKQIDKDGNNSLIVSNDEDTFDKKLKPKKTQKFNLNVADTLQLQSVYGIGSKLANRIVKFRDKLGGFHSSEQLNEVYGLKPETIENLLKKSELPNQLEIKKIRINHLDQKGIQQHPYISWKEAKFIIKYRNQHGPYKSIEALADIKVFDKKFIEKIAPYISYE